ncbi:disco-interacting 2-like isoform X1 [Paramuricea clavata]|nr:disco-interacting 2-like isoform X1 [Paramuricea clavata]
MAGRDYSSYPPGLEEDLKALDLELDEGDITQKGYEKKKARILAKVQQGPPPEPQANDRPERSHFKPGSDSPYHPLPVLRVEVVQAALAQRKSQIESHGPSPFKRQSLRQKTQTELEEVNIPVADYDGAGEPANGEVQATNQTSSKYRLTIEDTPASNAVKVVASRQEEEEVVIAQPVVVEGDRSKAGAKRRSQMQVVSIRLDSDSDSSNGPASPGKVSNKIQQLLNTLKRPKRKPLEQFFTDDYDVVEEPKLDPGAPKPEGTTTKPSIGDPLQQLAQWGNSLEEALYRYGTSHHKAAAISTIDNHCKTSYTLTYGKLLSKAQKIAHTLLNRVGNPKEGTSIMMGDRVALIYHPDDIVGFSTAFYGCLLAGITPVAVEPPKTKDDPGGQQIGFLLGSCGVTWVLTTETCFKTLPKDDTGNVVHFKGWPNIRWYYTEKLGKPPKDWRPPSSLDRASPAYIESTTGKDGSALGISVTRANMLSHCQMVTHACSYTAGEVMVSVLDFKREVGLWHSILTSVYNGMHVIFVPGCVLKTNPAMWLQVVTKQRATCALVCSRDLHWSLHATKEIKDVNLSSLRMLLLADRANPWSLSACDAFISAFERKGLKPESLCPCASSSETLTVAIRRPGKPGSTATGRGVLSLNGLSYGVVRVDKEGSVTSLTLQDCGTVPPGVKIVVVKPDGPPKLCKTDEVGELCVASGTVGSAYFGLVGKTNHTFKVQPLGADGGPVEQYSHYSDYVRTGLLGFLGPGGLVFICGTVDGLIRVSGRRHNADDLKSTILAVDPIKFVYRGRIAIFGMEVLREERIVVVAEQRPDCTEDEAFQWMSHVIPAIDSIHSVGIYCLCLLRPGGLPKMSTGNIHVFETKQRFLEGSLHPSNVLMCPHSCVTNLPKPRGKHQEPGPGAVMVGNLLRGTRIGEASGREIGEVSDADKRFQFLSEVLRWRAQSTPDHVLYSLLNTKGGLASTLSCIQLHKRAERVAQMAMECGDLSSGDRIALVFPPGIDLVVAVYACLYAGLIPIPIRPPYPKNVATTLPTLRMVIEVSQSQAILTTGNLAKLLKSKEALSVVNNKTWPLILNSDDPPKKKLLRPYNPPTPELLAYVDFSVSTTGVLTGVKMSHAAVTALCRSIKLSCELYPSRDICLCLDPYSGLGFLMWALTGVFSGHHTILVPPGDLEANPALWLTVVSQYKVRDTFCSYPVMDLCTKGLGQHIPTLKAKGVNLACVRSCVVVAEERPRINLTSAFSALFSGLGLSPRSVSTSFGCRVNVAICTQGSASPETSTVYVDARALRNDRVTLVEKGSPHSVCLQESGKILPGVKVVIANPESKGMLGDSHLGEIWVRSGHNGTGYFNTTGDDLLSSEHFQAQLLTGDTTTRFARTGYLGFIKRTDYTQTDGARHDALFVVGSLHEALTLRGMRYHPVDIENSSSDVTNLSASVLYSHGRTYWSLSSNWKRMKTRLWMSYR